MADPKNEQVDTFLAGDGDTEPQEEAQDAAPQQEAEAAPEKAPQEPAEPQKPPKGYVPLAALDEERGVIKTLRGELADRETKIGQMNDRFAEFVQKIPQAAPEPPEPLPNLEEDPLAYVAHLKQEIDDLKGMASQYGQQDQINNQMRQVSSEIAARADAFAKERPDYQDAVRGLQQKMTAAQMATGVSAGDASQQVAQDLQYRAIQALASGKDPAQVLYDTAKTFGWAPSKGEETVQSGTGGGDEAAARLKTVQQGQAVNRSPSQASGGASPGVPTTLEELADLGEGALDDKVWDKVVKGYQTSEIDSILKS